MFWAGKIIVIPYKYIKCLYYHGILRHRYVIMFMLGVTLFIFD